MNSCPSTAWDYTGGLKLVSIFGLKKMSVVHSIFLELIEDANSGDNLQRVSDKCSFLVHT